MELVGPHINSSGNRNPCSWPRTQTQEWQLAPRIDKQVCFAYTGDSGLGRRTALPSIKGWNYEGQTRLHNQTVNLWRYTAHHLGKVVDYRFYVSLDNKPVRLWMHGFDAISDSHFDEYVVDYTRFVPGMPAESVFAMPELCKGVKTKKAYNPDDKPTSGAAVRASAMLPHVSYRGGDAEYNAFLGSEHGMGRRHHSVEDYRRRAAVHSRNLRMIAEHNAREDKTFTMAMNKFGDWHEDEFLAAMMPNAHRRKMRAQRARQLGQAACDGAGVGCGDSDDSDSNSDSASSKNSTKPTYEIVYEPLLQHADRLPKEVSWRGSGADAPVVKDQSSCGSCWAFSATGAMEGAWYVATGKHLSLSEQEVVDCSWGVVDDVEDAGGCDGNEPWKGIAYAASAGGLARMRDYQYKGQDGYCRRNSTARAAAFHGWANVPSMNETAVKEALYSRGPLSVVLDASHDSFRFYSSGVYAEPDCYYEDNKLDHAVLLVGYGTSETEGDYWLIRNSWSDMWGDAGYMKVTRSNHGCGVASNAVYAVANPEGIKA